MVQKHPDGSMIFSSITLGCFLQRIKVSELLEDKWFKEGYKPPCFEEEEDINVDDVDAAFNDSKVLGFLQYVFNLFSLLFP